MASFCTIHEEVKDWVLDDKVDWKRIYGSLLMSDSRRALSEYSFLKSETLLWRGWTSLIHLVGCLDNLKDVEIPIVLTRTPLKLTNLMLQIVLCPDCRIVI